MARFLDDCELQDFISGTGWWGKWTATSKVLASAEETEVVDAVQADADVFEGSSEVG